MEFFNNIANLEELKKEYRRLCMKHHPDLGGDEETMKRLNAEYEKMVRSGRFSDDMNAAHTTADEEAAFRRILEKLAVLHDLIVEICGSWLWVYGQTFPHKDALKELGMKFASKKKCWYWHPEGYRRTNHREYNMEEIRMMHGSRVVKSSEYAPSV